MPKQRCLSCNRLIDAEASVRGRHASCAIELKNERNRQYREAGPCPQDGVCVYCKGLHGPATAKNPFVWMHWPVRFVDGGTQVAPGHKRCNESLSKKNPKG